MDRSSLARAYGPGIVLFLIAVLLHVVAPADPETGARSLGFGVLALLCLLAGLAWIMLQRLNWGRRKRLRITSESIAWFKGASLLATPPTLGEEIVEIRADEIQRIHAVRLNAPTAKILRRKGGLDAWAADLVLDDRTLRLSDLAWEADLNTLGRLKDFQSEHGFGRSSWRSAEAVSGPLMALRAAGYPILGEVSD
jgi:hypothetical protein